jgi:hypothetical protein
MKILCSPRKIMIATFIVSLLVVIFCVCGTSMAEMYRWVDENGDTQITDSPPPKAKSSGEVKIYRDIPDESQSKQRENPKSYSMARAGALIAARPGISSVHGELISSNMISKKTKKQPSEKDRWIQKAEFPLLSSTAVPSMDFLNLRMKRLSKNKVHLRKTCYFLDGVKGIKDSE